jgi:hypothetical protein
MRVTASNFHKYQCVYIGCNRRRHENCRHPNESTPRFWCTTSGCRRSKDNANGQPFFLKEHCQQHIRGCTTAKVSRRLFAKENSSQIIEPAILTTQNIAYGTFGQEDRMVATIEGEIQVNGQVHDVDANRYWHCSHRADFVGGELTTPSRPIDNSASYRNSAGYHEEAQATCIQRFQHLQARQQLSTLCYQTLSRHSPYHKPNLYVLAQCKFGSAQIS